MTEAILSSNLYTNAFLTEHPKDGVDLIQSRITTAIKLNQELADYFSERAHAEELYAESLAKLAKKRFIADEADLGHMLPVWNMLYAEVTQISSIHADLATKMEEISSPLRSSVENHADYKQIRSLEGDFQRLAKDYEELYAKTAKHKKKQTPGTKLSDYSKGLEEKADEWRRTGPDFIQLHQAIDASRWNTIKDAVEQFESVQATQLKKRVELASNIMGAASGFSVEDEVMAFCAGHQIATSPPPLHQADEPKLHVSSSTSTPVITLPSSSSDLSVKKKSAIKRLLSRPSIRRKPKGENGYVNADIGMFSNVSGIEDSSLSPVEPPETSDTPRTESCGASAATSPVSLSPPSLRKAPSFSGSFMSGLSSPPKVVVDSEGFSIPPPDRGMVWHDTSSADDFGSDASSMAGGSRLKVDITKNVVEDDPNAHMALTRVASLLKEKKSMTISGQSGRRGRRRLQQVPEQSVDHEPAALADPFKETAVHAISEDSSPQINVAITETVRATMANGQQKVAEVFGQVSIACPHPDSLPSTSPVCFQISNVNDIYLRGDYVAPLAGCPGVYQIDTKKLQALGSTAVMCVEYRTKAQVPTFLQIKPRWKCVCDQQQSLLLVKYKKSADVLPLENVRFTTPTGDALDMQSLPMGVLHAKKKECEWSFHTLAHEDEKELRAKFGMKQQANTQHIKARFTLAHRIATTASIGRGSLDHVLWADVQLSRQTCDYVIQVEGDVLHTSE